MGNQRFPSITRLGVLVLLASCAALQPTDRNIQASWVVLGEDGAAVARAVTTAAACPSLVQDGVARAMSVRAAPAILAKRTTSSAPEDSKPSAFPVLTCEAALDRRTRAASVGGRPLPIPSDKPHRIIVIGDSGCRMKLADDEFQACNDSAAWPFEQVADSAAAMKPDLVIHLGDYHYRENACPAGNAGCASSPWGYGWDAWQADFFTPAEKLLAAAPWVMIRGNHESCSRAGQGWWRFLDPRPLEAGRDCDAARDDSRGDYSAPYRVPIGDGAQLIVFDSSKAPSGQWKDGDPAIATYAGQFVAASELAGQSPFSIFAMHHPILGFAPVWEKASTDEAMPGNAALQQVMRGVSGARLFPKGTRLALSGHVHLFEAVGFSSDHPPQFVVGNAGTSLDPALPAKLSNKTQPYVDARHDLFSSASAFGFMTMEGGGSRWSMRARDRDGKPWNAWILQDGRLAAAATR
jgi:hypothetical protein